MKKTLISIALMALMLISTSSYNRDAIGTRIGEVAPSLQLANEQCEVELSKMQGNYVLLTFWSTSDAQSRQQCNRYNSWVNAHQPEGLQHISINFDKEQLLFDEIAQRDNLNTKAQFNVQGEQASRIMRDFGLADGFGTLLIGPDGRISAINPTTSTLSSLL